jgi:hypothetical protein
MINLAHNLGSPADMITSTQIYVQQPRDSNDDFSVLYCETEPANAELQGLYQCQFESSDPHTFTGGLPLGGPGTMPFAFTSPLVPAGGWCVQGTYFWDQHLLDTCLHAAPRIPADLFLTALSSLT